ncbi:uncharacterized protein [Oscarella lobularis]|uniref:uncharacterized protein n=1 Tax=Oscarella lobularis TaxID=121494 RepID=UPI003313AE38
MIEHDAAIDFGAEMEDEELVAQIGEKISAKQCEFEGSSKKEANAEVEDEDEKDKEEEEEEEPTSSVESYSHAMDVTHQLYLFAMEKEEVELAESFFMLEGSCRRQIKTDSGRTKADTLLVKGRKAESYDGVEKEKADDSRKIASEECNSEIVLIPGGCTSIAQPMDRSVNKPFKESIRESWSSWMRQNGGGKTPAGNLKQPTRQNVIDWVAEAWRKISPELLVKSLLVCGISNALDGSEDDLLSDDLPRLNEEDEGGNESDEEDSPSDSDDDDDLSSFGDEEDDD